CNVMGRCAGVMVSNRTGRERGKDYPPTLEEKQCERHGAPRGIGTVILVPIPWDRLDDRQLWRSPPSAMACVMTRMTASWWKRTASKNGDQSRPKRLETIR
ncbi:MAG TPA: hypothetical protein VJ453_13965, partial [Terriglobales bacterium]|nr:hypothetical protein [Terriglobales bacterium]